jgi:hypothetical protein
VANGPEKVRLNSRSGQRPRKIINNSMKLAVANGPEITTIKNKKPQKQ